MRAEQPVGRAAGRSGSRAVMVALLALACVAAVATAGCYRRVVGARGLGASQYDVQQPYQESGEIDNWLFGPAQQPKQGGGVGM